MSARQPEVARATSRIHVVDGTRQRFDLVDSLDQALPVNERIARLAEAFLGKEVGNAVVTVPGTPQASGQVNCRARGCKLLC